MLSEPYGGEATKNSSVSEWHKPFEEGRESMEDDGRSGRPRSHKIDENVEQVRNLVHSDRRLSIRAMDAQLNSDKNTVKKPTFWPNGSILHHDDDPSHKALSSEFMAQKIDH
jgi:hypothetical protein